MIYRDIKINFELRSDAEMSGDGYIEFNKAATDFIVSYYQENYEKDEYPAFVEGALTHHEESGDETLTTHEIDAFILMMNALLYSDSKDFEVTVSYEHVIWLFHDLSHIENDATDSDIEVNQWSEEQAIKRSIQLCVENGVAVPWSIIETTKTEYKKRFFDRLDLSDLVIDQKIDTTNFTLEAL